MIVDAEPATDRGEMEANRSPVESPQVGGSSRVPVYGCPKLLDGVSAKLKARMQGKSCFNFKTADPALFAELERLSEAGIAAFRTAGYIP